MTPRQLDRLKKDFDELRDPIKGKKRIKKSLQQKETDFAQYLAPWLALSKEASHVYPSQGLLFTPHDYLHYDSLQMLPQETIVKTLRLRRFFLEMSNHPYRIHFLKEVESKPFHKIQTVECSVFPQAEKLGLSLSIGDLGAAVVGSEKPRTSRTDRYAQGPFVKLGKHARGLFVGSASPDVWNSAPSIATMAASHCLATIPRNGLTSSVERQSDLAKEVFTWLGKMEDDILVGRQDRKEIGQIWKRNVVGTLEANPQKAPFRAEKLYNTGVRAFRIYSPEPGTGTVETTKLMRKLFGTKVEIFAGQIIDVLQAQKAQEAGADGLFIGIGGGGRCITGVRSGSVVDWPALLWQMRGKIEIPVIVEGGASDHVAVTLLLGASAIGVSRVVSGGTMESPGGALYCANSSGRLFKPYGGEASARTKYLDGKLLPFNIPSFVEGETTTADLSYIKHVYPTLTYNLHTLTEDAILAMVFRNAENLESLHNINPSPLRRNTSSDVFQRDTH